MLAKIADDINQVNKDGDSALILSARNGHAPIVQLLLSNAAQGGLVNHKKESARNAAFAAGHAQVVQLLRSSDAPDSAEGMSSASLPAKASKATDEQNSRLLMRAAGDGDLQQVRRLLAEGANVDSADELGRTALMQGRGRIAA